MQPRPLGSLYSATSTQDCVLNITVGVCLPRTMESTTSFSLTFYFRVALMRVTPKHAALRLNKHLWHATEPTLFQTHRPWVGGRRYTPRTT